MGFCVAQNIRKHTPPVIIELDISMDENFTLFEEKHQSTEPNALCSSLPFRSQTTTLRHHQSFRFPISHRETTYIYVYKFTLDLLRMIISNINIIPIFTQKARSIDLRIDAGVVGTRSIGLKCLSKICIAEWPQ